MQGGTSFLGAPAGSQTCQYPRCPHTPPCPGLPTFHRAAVSAALAANRCLLENLKLGVGGQTRLYFELCLLPSLCSHSHIFETSISPGNILQFSTLFLRFDSPLCFWADSTVCSSFPQPPTASDHVNKYFYWEGLAILFETISLCMKLKATLLGCLPPAFLPCLDGKFLSRRIAWDEMVSRVASEATGNKFCQ
jgi:hypothetical protein